MPSAVEEVWTVKIAKRLFEYIVGCGQASKSVIINSIEVDDGVGKRIITDKEFQSAVKWLGTRKMITAQWSTSGKAEKNYFLPSRLLKSDLDRYRSVFVNPD